MRNGNVDNGKAKQFAKYYHQFIPTMQHFFYQMMCCECLSMLILIAVSYHYIKFFDLGLAAFYPSELLDKVKSGLPMVGKCTLSSGAPGGGDQGTNTKCAVTLHFLYFSFAVCNGYLYLIGLILMCLHVIYTLVIWSFPHCRK